MGAEEMYIKRVQELMSGIDRGDFSDVSRPPEAFRFGHLTALFYLADCLENGRKLYEQVYDRVMAYGQYHIRHKVASGQKIRVAFLAISAAEWAVENVYRSLIQDERLECFVVVCPLMDRKKEDRMRSEEMSYHFFQEQGYNTRRIYHSEQDQCDGWESLGGVPDLVIHLTSWYNALPEQYQIEQLPLHTVNCYIPYGMYVADSPDGNYVKQLVYNKEFVNLQWRVFADSRENLAGYQEHELLHGKNVRCSGYAKMDYFRQKREYTPEQIHSIWKLPAQEGMDNRKRVIIAPHHSITPSAGIQYATFLRNAYFWLYLAKKYQDKITFIFKPHPNLRWKTVWAHMFEAFEEYDEYLEAWNTLPNAKVVEEQSYLEIFATSDGIIMDSASFIGEYLYVDKPVLFLTRREQAFNSLGAKIMPCYQTAEGGDYTAIEQFLVQVILGEEDTKKNDRGRTYRELLDYVSWNDCLASEYICQDILSLLEQQQNKDSVEGAQE